MPEGLEVTVPPPVPDLVRERSYFCITVKFFEVLFCPLQSVDVTVRTYSPAASSETFTEKFLFSEHWGASPCDAIEHEVVHPEGLRVVPVTAAMPDLEVGPVMA